MAPPENAGYVSLVDLAKYSGLSVRRLRRHIDGPPGEALPVYRVGRGKILVRRAPRRDRLHASERVVTLSATAALERATRAIPPIEHVALAAIHIGLAIAIGDAEA